MTVPLVAAKKKKLVKTNAQTGIDVRIFFQGITAFVPYLCKSNLEDQRGIQLRIKFSKELN